MDSYHMLVETHIELANKLANKKKRSLPRRIDIEELKSAAYLGLVEAALRFNAGRGVSFVTFAYRRIWGAMNDYLRELGVITVSLDSSTEDESSLADTIVAPAAPVNCEEVLEVVANGLENQAKEVLRLYFYEDVPMKEVGKKFGVTESRVSQILTGYKKDIRSRWTFNELQEELAA